MQRADVPHEPSRAGRPGGSRGPLVVSMRPMTPAQAVTADARLRAASRGARRAGARRRPGGARHPRPAQPDFGDPVEIRAGEVPVFWACGVTPQAVVMAAKPPFAITHAPGHMFVTDARDSDYLVTGTC